MLSGQERQIKAEEGNAAMTKADRTRTGGISLKVIHILMIALAIIISLMLVFSTYQSSTVFSKLNQATGNYAVRQKAAHDLMEASDYLTEMVQHFTLEGDTVYLDKYFEEAFVSRRREASITTMAENDADQGLVEQLQQALNESQSLMYREYYAMKLVIEARNIREYPEQLRSIELKEADAMLSPEEKMDLAQKMVMGKEYYSRKEIIRTKLKTSLEMMDKRMTATRQETSAQLTKELTLSRIVIIVLTAAILVLIWLSSHLGITPLIRAVQAVKNNEPVPMIGAREFRFMAESYNGMMEKGQEHGEKTEEKEA